MRGSSLFDTFRMSSDIRIIAVLLRLKFDGAASPHQLSAYSAQFSYSMQFSLAPRLLCSRSLARTGAGWVREIHGLAQD